MIRLAIAENLIGLPEWVYLDSQGSLAFRIFKAFCKYSLDYPRKYDFYLDFCNCIIGAEEVELTREEKLVTSEIVDVTEGLVEFQSLMEEQWFSQK